MGSAFLNDFVRVSEAFPCPVCTRTDWCVVHRDGLSAICQRVESGLSCGGAGYLHALDEELEVPEIAKQMPERLSEGEIAKHVYRWRNTMTFNRLETLSAELSVDIRSLTLLDVGWRGDCYAFPMRNARSEFVGVRFRNAEGRKWSLRGGQEGLFFPRGQWMPGAEQVFVCEGATDTAALMTAGIPVVVGRPSCTGGVADVSWALNRYQDRQRPVVIVADSDVPGLDGACLLASQICGRFDSVVIAPTWYKDAREVCENGGGLLSIIDAVAGRNNKFWERVPT